MVVKADYTVSFYNVKTVRLQSKYKTKCKTLKSPTVAGEYLHFTSAFTTQCCIVKPHL